MRFGEWLRQERKRRGLKWADMEALTGMSKTALDNIERNPKAKPGFETIVKIVDGLKVSREHVWKVTGGDPQGVGLPRLTREQMDAIVRGSIEELNEPARSAAHAAYQTLAILLQLPGENHNTS